MQRIDPGQHTRDMFIMDIEECGVSPSSAGLGGPKISVVAACGGSLFLATSPGGFPWREVSKTFWLVIFQFNDRQWRMDGQVTLLLRTTFWFCARTGGYPELYLGALPT